MLLFVHVSCDNTSEPETLGKRGAAWNHLDPKSPAAYQSAEPTRAQGPADKQAANDQEKETKEEGKGGGTAVLIRNPGVWFGA